MALRELSKEKSIIQYTRSGNECTAKVNVGDKEFIQNFTLGVEFDQVLADGRTIKVVSAPQVKESSNGSSHLHTCTLIYF